MDTLDSHKLYKELNQAVADGRSALKLFVASLDLVRIQLKLHMDREIVQRGEDDGSDCQAILLINTNIAFDVQSIYILDNVHSRAEASLNKITRILRR